MKRINVAPEEADIVDLTHEARGVARVDGKTVFIDDALPGERVVLRRIVRHRNFDEAVTERVLQASAVARRAALRALRRLRWLRAAASRSGGATHVQADATGRKPRPARRRRSPAACSHRCEARSGITGAARGSASSTCRARARCWSGSANGRRHSSRTFVNATCSRTRSVSCSSRSDAWSKACRS